MKHTKGNWKVYADTIQNEDGLIAEIATQNGNSKNWQANAKLIAAAPDMLEACKLALVVLRGLDSSALVIPILEQTINKATKAMTNL